MEESNKENQVFRELQSNHVLAVESLENSQLLHKDIGDLKQTLNEKILLNEFYTINFEEIHKLQRFFKNRYHTKRFQLKSSNQIQKLKMENINLRNENSKLKTENKALILEMSSFLFKT